MRYSIITCVGFFLLLFSCATLNISEIENLEKLEFEPLILKPGKETNNLRIDFIRQTYSEFINDSTEEIRDVPYSPIGFDLGNGLFYDLNNNICLRVDYLLDISSSENFEIQETNRPKKNKGINIYKFYNDSLTVTKLKKEKVRQRYYQIRNQDSISYMYKNKLRYSIYESDTSYILSGRKKIRQKINQIDINRYSVGKGRRNKYFQINENELQLGNKYLMTLTDNKETIYIMRDGKRRDKVLYKIEKNDNTLFIYNRKYSGLKIDRDGKTVLIYKNDKPLVQYSLQSKSGRSTL
jgi:hypothetical protein